MSDSCFERGERMLSVDDAAAALRELTPHPLATERLPLASLLGRVVAEDIHSPINVPQNTNAALDGIALAWSSATQTRLEVIGESLAGQRYEGKITEGQAVAITTGAPLPAGADTVIMQEQLAFGGDAGNSWVEIQRPKAVKQGQNVRMAGEDIARNALALAAGTRLKAQHLGLLASLGCDGAVVYRRPNVAIFSTGDEVTAPGTPLPQDGIYDANRFSLHGLLVSLGCNVVDLGILSDEPGQVEQALMTAADEADMVITSGGVSVGQADWIKHALHDAGRLCFWRIAMRPGKPLACGVLGKREVPFFGLPGNPVAVMVTFLQFVQPLLRTMQGEMAWRQPRLVAVADDYLSSREGRVDYLRGVYACDDQGQLHVRSTGQQGSGILTSMVAANCLIEIDTARSMVKPGETVTIQPFES
ncbi:molybdopterin molybdotransferase MoeA [Modicisalibacter luteus]|uniref:Molybdopterin molybdenumtransferase n=1 Tax=Modicisalibacter luteus TaxID=453962 RepID=A0ABV7M3D7_9GAMM|nr:gephyrin-like molybdotransferase Glp [Halomonas lutea]GHA83866.1 hypothetical protein GCM10007159_00940 [Halomonas lutea]